MNRQTLRGLLPSLRVATAAALVGLWLGAAAPPSAAATGVPPDDAAEIVETLLGLDPARHADPLAAMKGWAALYARHRTAARAGDPVSMRLWLLMAHTAAAKADAGSSESFSGDLLPAYQAQPRVMLSALADNTWLVPVTCYFLGKHFDFENRRGAGRAEFIATQEPLITSALPGAWAGRCLALIKEPRQTTR